mgnify:CR=1 FL=1
MKPILYIVIPCYNEQESIERVVANLKEKAPFADYLIVNDCSRDNTEKILRANGMNYINNPINLGIGGGVQAGYLYAKQNGYDIAVQMDGDGQHDAAYLNEMADFLVENQCDMVIGSAMLLKQESLTPEEQKAFQEAVSPMYDSFLDADQKAIVERIQALG